MKATVDDRCTLCFRKFGEVVHRFDSSSHCTVCQHYESDAMKVSRMHDKEYADRRMRNDPL